MPTNDKNDKDHVKQQKKLISIVQQVIEHDEALRKKYKVHNKFRFVQDRLKALVELLESELKTTRSVEKKMKVVALGADEVAVYVYLFNAHGSHIKSWQNMLLPNVFYEYSVNRPIYADKSQIMSLLRAKSDPNQHAYLTVAVKKSDILKSEVTQKDNYGNDILKVKEGSLQFKKLMLFTHNERHYFVTEKGELILQA